MKDAGIPLIDEDGVAWAVVFPDDKGLYDHGGVIVDALRGHRAEPQTPMTPEDRLETERNDLQNSYGGGSFQDGLITRRIAEIDKELAALALSRPKLGGDK